MSNDVQNTEPSPQPGKRSRLRRWLLRIALLFLFVWSALGLLVLAVADEVVRTGCSAAGRPDAYRPDSVRYISSEQFAYCAGVNGMILRDRPAANFYLGRFFAESLIFAETGFAAGSIQIAGTAEVTQLPFFIAACDYTLIGEEFFAAGAYLSQDEMLLSTLKAADWTKVLLVTLLLTGSLLMSLGYPEFREWFVVR